MYANFITKFSNIINNINIDWTIRFTDIISIMSVITTIAIAFATIYKNNKNVNKQLIQQQKQLEKSQENHIENKNIELRKNQIEYLPIIDMCNIHCSSDGKEITFKFDLKNIGNGTALKCIFDNKDKLIVYSDPNDPGLQYIQSSPGSFVLNINDSFNTSIITNRLPNNYVNEVKFSVVYNDLMGRTYKQLFVFHYMYPKLTHQITNKYEWECIHNIKFKP